MYAIRYDGIPPQNYIHHPSLYNIGLIVDNPILTNTLNAHGTLQFTISPKNEQYESLHTLETILVVEDDGIPVWRGRILNQTVDINQNKKIICEGQLAFLCDSVICPYVWYGSVRDFFVCLIEEHNRQADAKHQLLIGRISSDFLSTDIHRSSETADTVWEIINKKIIEPLGAYIMVRIEPNGNYIDLLSEITDICHQDIEYGKNLVDYNVDTDSDNIYTAIIPYGVEIESGPGHETEPEEQYGALRTWNKSRLTIADVNDGQIYIENPDGIALYGRIFRSKTWDDITTAAKLKTVAQNDMYNSIFKNTAIEAKAVDLSLIDKSKPSIKVGQLINVYSTTQRISVQLLCKQIQIPMMNVGNTTIQLGAGFKALTDYK